MDSTFVTNLDKLARMRRAPKELGEWLLAEMQAKNWSARETARMAGLSHPVISDILSGYQPSTKTCAALAKLFNYSELGLLRMAGIVSPDADTDPWVEEKAYKLSKLDPELREIADDFIDGLVRRQERNKRRTKPARP